MTRAEAASFLVWPATDFVRRLRDEYCATSEANMTGTERREAA